MNTSTQGFDKVLEELGQHTGALPVSEMYVFSDLSGQTLAAFRSAFDSRPPHERLRLVQALADLAEASFQVSFDAIFRHCLADSHDEIRAAAIDGLWENEDVALLGPFLTMLRTDPSARVRAAAASALGRYVLAGELEQIEPSIQARVTSELLTSIHLAGETSEVRCRAIESVSYACNPEVLEVLETAYDEDDELMQLSAIVGMGRSCDRRWMPIILAELESSSPAMRYEAALASGNLEMREAIGALAKLADDADPQVRGAAIWSLGQISGDEAKQALLDALDDADDDTAAAIEDALAEQALLEGELDLALYELDDDGDDGLLDDLFLEPWDTDDEMNDEPE